MKFVTNQNWDVENKKNTSCYDVAEEVIKKVNDL